MVEELTATNDMKLVPPLTQSMQSFLSQGHFYGRDVIADALMRLQGVEALSVLVGAAAVDLGDDQDSLHAIIVDATYGSTDRAAELLEPAVIGYTPCYIAE